MNAVRQRHRGNRLKGAVAAALGVAALALGLRTLVAAQNDAGKSSAGEDAATEGASSEAASLTERGTSDSSTFSTFEVPAVTTPVAGGNDDQPLRAATPASIEGTPCASCDQDPDAPIGEAGIPDTASYIAQDSAFDADDVTSSWIGLSLIQDRRKLKSGEYANGLLIVDVQAGSPAAKAGLQPPIEGKAREVAEMATLAAGMVFPPVIVGVAIISSTQLDWSYDMIIGIDGDRIKNMLDFEDHMRAVQPGEIIYLNIVRNGTRQQVPVYVPADTDN